MPRHRKQVVIGIDLLLALLDLTRICEVKVLPLDHGGMRVLQDLVGHTNPRLFKSKPRLFHVVVRIRWKLSAGIEK